MMHARILWYTSQNPPYPSVSMPSPQSSGRPVPSTYCSTLDRRLTQPPLASSTCYPTNPLCHSYSLSPGTRPLVTVNPPIVPKSDVVPTKPRSTRISFFCFLSHQYFLLSLVLSPSEICGPLRVSEHRLDSKQINISHYIFC